MRYAMRWLALAVVSLWPTLASMDARAASPVTVCGPSGTAGQNNCIIPNSDGSIDVSGGGGGGAVTIADGADVTEGALADAACATDNGTCSVNAVLKRVAQRLTTLINSLGGTASTGAAVPATAVYNAAGSDGGLAAGTAALTGLISCNNSVKIDTASSGNVELVALTSGETVYVCGYELVAAGTVSVQWITGTGTACATNEFDESGAMPLIANSGIVSRSPFYTGLSGGAGDAFCIELSAAVQVSGILYYTKF